MTDAAGDTFAGPATPDGPLGPQDGSESAWRPSILVQDQPVTAQFGSRGPLVETLYDLMTAPETRPPVVIGLYGPDGQSTTGVLRQLWYRVDSWSSDRGPTHRLAHRPGEGRSRVRTRLTRSWVWGRLRRAGDATTRLDYEMKPLGGEPVRPITVWFNPWMYERRDQISAGLHREILVAITERLSGPDRERLWFDLELRRTDAATMRNRLLRSYLPRTLPGLIFATVLVLLVVATAIATGVAALNTPAIGNLTAPVTVILLAALATVAQLSTGTLKRPPGWAGPTPAHPHSARSNTSDDLTVNERGAEAALQQDLIEVLQLAAWHSPLYVFVDDINRSRPDIVADTVEAINSFLNRSMGPSIFVLGLDPSAVAHRLDTAFASPAGPTDPAADAAHPAGWRFIEKMVDLPVRLPRLSDAELTDYVARLLDSGSPAGPTTAPSPPMSGVPSSTVALVVLPEAPPLPPDHPPVPSLEDLPSVRDALRDAALRLPGRDPRQAQVLISLWRFYLVLEYRSGLLSRNMASLELHAIEIVRLVELMVRWPQLLDILGDPAVDDPNAAPLDQLLAACFGDEDEPWGTIARQYRLEPTDRAVQGLRQLLRRALPHLDEFTELARRYL